MVLKEYIAGWSSLEARQAHNPKVIGSNPIPATYAQIAQLVEQRTENPRVAGSIPALGIFVAKSNEIIEFFFLAQLVEHLTFNQVVRGSNPPPPIAYLEKMCYNEISSRDGAVW